MALCYSMQFADVQCMLMTPSFIRLSVFRPFRIDGFKFDLRWVTRIVPCSNHLHMLRGADEVLHLPQCPLRRDDGKHAPHQCPLRWDDGKHAPHQCPLRWDDG